MKRSKRERVTFLYRFLLRMGEMEAARYLFCLLRNGSVSLSLHESAGVAECALEQVLDPDYSSNGNTRRFHLVKS